MYGGFYSYYIQSVAQKNKGVEHQLALGGRVEVTADDLLNFTDAVDETVAVNAEAQGGVGEVAAAEQIFKERGGELAGAVAVPFDELDHAGVDEVGRGPLAGPVVAACVVLPEDFDVPGVDDSKKLSEKKREALYDEIMSRALAVGIGRADNLVIDEINILQATKQAMKEAVAAADQMLRRELRLQ